MSAGELAHYEQTVRRNICRALPTGAGDDCDGKVHSPLRLPAPGGDKVSEQVLELHAGAPVSKRDARDGGVGVAAWQDITALVHFSDQPEPSSVFGFWSVKHCNRHRNTGIAPHTSQRVLTLSRNVDECAPLVVDNMATGPEGVVVEFDILLERGASITEGSEVETEG